MPDPTQVLGRTPEDPLRSPVARAATHPSSLNATGLHSTSTHATGFISPTISPTHGDSAFISKGEIGGIVVGVLILLIILGATVTRYWWRRRAPHALGNINESPMSDAPNTTNIHGPNSTVYAPLTQNSNPGRSCQPPPQLTSTSIKPSKPDYYGGGKCVLSWEAPASAQGSSRPPPRLNSQPQLYAEFREAHPGTVSYPSTPPPRYNPQWMQ
ncbi:hypothetical protein B0H17DRAFT_1055799 [Mycena rosella]|uniref:Uncharacterized protein n=1 Tax=Mycena rosella TaxID=1033263 RepID=A0AAD7DQQ8_MYCRO|nr:hypothetical protein B0H17DRAFT_1055799 [Mycena rosella]